MSELDPALFTMFAKECLNRPFAIPSEDAVLCQQGNQAAAQLVVPIPGLCCSSSSGS